MRAEGTAAVATGFALVVVAAVAMLVAGLPAVASASLGVAVVVVFFALGALVDARAARHADWTAAFVFFVSYALRMAMLALVAVVLADSGLLASPRWFGIGLGVATCAWVAGLFGAHVTGRWPIYDRLEPIPNRLEPIPSQVAA